MPVIPGYNGDDQSLETLTKAALGIGMGQGRAEQSKSYKAKLGDSQLKVNGKLILNPFQSFLCS